MKTPRKGDIIWLNLHKMDRQIEEIYCEKNILGLINIVKELLSMEVLHYDPKDHNQMIMWYSGIVVKPFGTTKASFLLAQALCLMKRLELAKIIVTELRE